MATRRTVARWRTAIAQAVQEEVKYYFLLAIARGGPREMGIRVMPSEARSAAVDATPSTVLLVDDRTDNRESLGLLLQTQGYEVREASSVSEAVKCARRHLPDVVLTDIRLEVDSGGFRLLQLVRDEQPWLPVILYTAFPAIPDAVRAVKIGAFDYFELSLDGGDTDALLLAVADAVRVSAVSRATARQNHSQSPPTHECDEMVVASRAMQEVMRRVRRIGPANVAVLITGETGTGKELVARVIHSKSRRALHPFVPVNCGGIPEALAESELFGHRKGAFTGAVAEKRGLVAEADGGTLFLDEVAELSPSIQVALLRFLDTGELRRVGDNQVRRLDVRIVAATNRHIEREVSTGRFREDLYFRLKGATFYLPPLRERPEDLDALVTFWLPRLSERAAAPIRGITESAHALLRQYSWPGNVRELYHVLELAVVMTEEGLITEEALRGEFRTLRVNQSGGSERDKAPCERDRILAALQEHRWNLSDTAKSLGISRKTLYRWRRRLGLLSASENPRGDLDIVAVHGHSFGTDKGSDRKVVVRRVSRRALTRTESSSRLLYSAREEGCLTGSGSGSRRREQDLQRSTSPGSAVKETGAFMDIRKSCYLAAKGLIANRWFTLGTISTVAVCTCIATAVFAVVDGVLFKELPYSHPDRLFVVSVVKKGPATPNQQVSLADVDRWRTVLGGVTLSAYLADFGIGPPSGVRSPWETTWAAQVDRRFFDVLGQYPIAGGFRDHHFTIPFSLDEPLVQHPVIISDRLWNELFNRDRSALDSSFRASEGTVQVVGILPPDFVFPGRFGRTLPDVLLPLPDADYHAATRDTPSVRAICRLSANVRPHVAQAALSASTSGEQRNAKPEMRRVLLEPVSDVLGAGQRDLFKWITWAASCLLIFAVLNVSALLATQVSQRSREIAIRRALGARYIDIMLRFVAEAGFLGFGGAVLGLFATQPLLEFVRVRLPVSWVLVKAPAIDGRVIPFAFLASVVVVAIATVVFYLSVLRQANSEDLLRGASDDASARHAHRRRVILMLEGWVGLVLVLLALVTLSYAWRLWHDEIGFDRDRLAIVDVRVGASISEASIPTVVDDALRFVQAWPGVELASAVDGPFMRRASVGSNFELGSGGEAQGLPAADDVGISPQFFRTLGIASIEGRVQTDAELEGGAPVVVVSHGLARALWPYESAIGRTLTDDQGKVTVIGVAEDIRLNMLEDTRTQQIYLSRKRRAPSQNRALLLRTNGDPHELAVSIAPGLEKAFPMLFVTRAEGMKSAARKTASARELEAIVFGAFGAAALVLFAVSTLAVLGVNVVTRRREIAIRMALGAAPNDVRVMVAWDAMRFVLVGLVVGSLTSWWLIDVLKAVTPAFTAVGAGSWAVSWLVLIGVAAVAAWLPTWQAGKYNAASVLKEM